MKAFLHPFERLAEAEQTFRVEGPWRGGFQSNRHHVVCSLGGDDWLRLEAPVAGHGGDLLRHQGGLLMPVRFAAGPTLIAEMPAGEDLVLTFDTLRDAFAHGLATLCANPNRLSEPHQVDCEGSSVLAALAENGFIRHPAGECLVRIGAAATIDAVTSGRAVVLRTSIIDLGSARPVALDALAHFALATNARFRFSRTGFVGGRLVQEVAVPMTALTPAVVERAVRSIGDTCVMTKKACAALAVEQVARQYLEFHEPGEDAHADTHH
jgi:hypothetical protein